MADIKNIQTTILVPASFDSDQRELAARFIIEKIQENTANGMSSLGKKFAPYTEDYVNSLDFENAGKTRKVNLEATGDMLISIQLISHKTGSITIGYPTGSSIADQVEGNVIGSYGSDPNPSKARPFIGLPQSQVELIIAKVESQTSEDINSRSGVDSIISGLLGRFYNEG